MPIGYSSIPPRQSGPYRQLGSGGQQPVRVQMILGLLVGLVLVAVPLYLWRRPERASLGAPASEGSADAASKSRVADPSAPSHVPLVDAPAAASKLRLEPFKTVRCSDAGPGKTPPERCDHITFFEDALARAVKENVLCAPATKTGTTVSFVMDLNFRRKALHLFRGKSSSLPAAQTKELFSCIAKAMPTPDWDSIPHQHARYVVNLTVAYPPSETF
ncbi:MAG: hypothetical protein EXR75_01720 [Myxococcales bacterium]|nr:hypothetical protein [Myxococcales bacterium]